MSDESMWSDAAVEAAGMSLVADVWNTVGPPRLTPDAVRKALDAALEAEFQEAMPKMTLRDMARLARGLT